MAEFENTAPLENIESWLPLTEYSVRTGMSVSTIRRKIKSNSIAHRLEGGKYMVLYQPGSETTAEQVLQATPAQSSSKPSIPTSREQEPPVQRNAQADALFSMPLVEKTMQMVSGAFEQSLSEKDERIKLLEDQKRGLEDRLDELRTLVQVLEEKYQVRY